MSSPVGSLNPNGVNIRHWASCLVNAAIVLVLLVVLMGGWTRINDAGLSCPDWPGCFGQMSVPSTAAQIDTASLLYPNIVLEADKSWLEMMHRYMAAALALLILSLALIAWHFRRDSSYPHLLSLALLLLICGQAMLGMWTVTLKLLPIVVTAHLLGGLLTIILLLLLRIKIQSCACIAGHWGGANYAVLLGLALLFLQILLGGWTSSNYALWGCSDWLGCNPSLDIDYDFHGAFAITLDSTYSHQGGNLALAERGAIQITHRVGAVVVAGYFIWLYFAIARYLCWANACAWLVILTVLQIILGVMNVVWSAPALLAMAHHLVAVMMLIQTTVVLVASFGSLKGESV